MNLRSGFFLPCLSWRFHEHVGPPETRSLWGWGEKMSSEKLFELRGVSKIYGVRGGVKFSALENICLELKRGVAYALVGESGSGKTTLGRLLVGMVHPTEGEIIFEGKKLGGWLGKERSSFCRKVQVIFQNPYLSLDPKWDIREILFEGIWKMSGRERKRKITAILDRVRLPTACLHKKPHALSGGERQRVAIARALLVEPEFLILDEPTSQLDVSTQSEIMALLRELRPILKGGMLFITHDISLASELAEVFIVMRRGEIVEQGLKKEILMSSVVPYTQQLLAAIPPWPPLFLR